MLTDFTRAQWINPPQHSRIAADTVELTTEPRTDFWQRSYYGFRNDNAHALQLEQTDNFTFTVKTDFDYQKQFDQCGVIVYLDSENWFKASIEFETSQYSRLGSVVTTHGYSDWATTDISNATSMWDRLSRRGPDFLIETSTDGQVFKQMRIFHLHQLGETTPEMGLQDSPSSPQQAVRFGVYACSPNPSSFTARFSQFKLEACRWVAHRALE
jgi:uncharacterized protein